MAILKLHEVPQYWPFNHTATGKNIKTTVIRLRQQPQEGYNSLNINTEWKDYQILATGGGQKLERWGNVYLLRPDPQVIWQPRFELEKFEGLNALYERSSGGGGRWKKLRPFPDSWVVGWRDLKFKIMPMGFKHTGLFPEQAANWQRMTELIRAEKREISVLNLFAYTGGATLACLSAGASVCHVDAARAMVDRCAENIRLSGLEKANVRYIVDDCMKFVAREIRRGKRYDAIIMDPPSFGRGPSGELWKIEDGLYSLVEQAARVLSDNPLFFLINSYTTGLQPSVLGNMLNIHLGTRGGASTAYEVCLPTDESGVVLPCGASGLWVNTVN